VAKVTAATAAAAAAAANLSGPPMTAVCVALGNTMTRERAEVSEAAAVDGGTMTALLSALEAAVAGGVSTAVALRETIAGYPAFWLDIQLCDPGIQEKAGFGGLEVHLGPKKRPFD